jgi:hypothetical protein
MTINTFLSATADAVQGADLEEPGAPVGNTWTQTLREAFIQERGLPLPMAGILAHKEVDRIFLSC